MSTKLTVFLPKCTKYKTIRNDFPTPKKDILN